MAMKMRLKLTQLWRLKNYKYCFNIKKKANSERVGFFYVFTTFINKINRTKESSSARRNTL